MRVSSSMMFQLGTRGLLNLQSEMFKTQDQLSTGRRILTPADDPIGASEVLEISQSKGVNEQFIENQADARVKLTLADGVMEQVGNQLTRVVEIATQAGNSTYGDAQRGMLVSELKLRLESLIGLANSQDGTGQFLFAGNKSTVEPFSLNTAATPPAPSATVPVYDNGSNSYVNYAGDAGTPTLQVSNSKTMKVTENGLQAFMQVRDAQGEVTGKSLFDTLKNLIDVVNPSSGMSFDVGELKKVTEEVKLSISHVANIRARFGASLNSLDSLTTIGEDVDYLYESRLGELQDLDYTEAISRYTMLQTQLEATQKTFKQTSQMSLFNIL